MATVKTDDKHYKNIAQAIRDKTGGNAQYKPGEMADGVGEVYDAGYAQGQAECDSVYYAGYEAGMTDGKKAEYDRFWDNLQNNGKRTDYQQTFEGYWCEPELFYPKYDLRPSGDASNMFYKFGGTYIDLAQRLLECGVVLDTGNVTNATYLFGNSSAFTRLPTVDLRKATTAKYVFYGCRNLVTIDTVILSETTGIEKDLFGQCYVLENVTFDGVIGKSISFYQCSKLTNASVQSAIDHLKDLTGQTALTLTFHATVGGKLTEAQKATITAKNWTLVY
jgi:hypothetical protein